MAQFKEINPSDITENAFKLIGKDWMLVTAGNSTKLNTMTASWGGIGVLWNKNVAFSFIRPQRYTLEFIDRNEYYTLSFLQDGCRDTLTFCGRNSGRDVDKIKEKNLTPVFDENAPYFEQARLVLICKKLYKQAMTPDSFVDTALIEKNYPENDFHYTFVGEIVKVLIKDV